MSDARVPLRVAIVGCGGIAAAHADALGASPDATLAGAVDPSAEARGRIAERWGCPTFGDLDELLESASVQAACVCTPPATHRVLVERLASAGVHVLCEKPAATTSADARAMVAAAREAGVALMMSAKFRHVEQLAEARRRIEAGEIGRPLFWEVTFCAPVDVAGRWPVRPEVSGGGVVMDNGPHAFDVLEAVGAPRPASVGAAFAPSVVSPAVEDTAEALFVLEDGALARVALSWTYFSRDLDYFLVQGSEGALRVGWTGAAIRRHGEREWTLVAGGYDKGRAFANQLAEFARRARSGSPAVTDQPVRGMEFVESIYRARNAGRRVEIQAGSASELERA